SLRSTLMQFRKRLLQFTHAEANPGLYRSERHPQPLGDFRVRISIEIGERDRLSLIGGQFRQRSMDYRLGLARDDFRFRGVPVGEPPRPCLYRTAVAPGLRADLPQAVYPAAACDLHQPRHGAPAGGIIGAGLSPGLPKGFL